MMKLVQHNKLQLVWVPGQMGTDGNETADEQVRQGSLHPLIGPGCQAHDQGLGKLETWSIGSSYVDKSKLRAFLKTLFK
jgi:hypothetical protein